MAIYKPPESESTFDSTFDSTFVGEGMRQRGSSGGATFQKIGVNYAIRHRVPIVNKRTSRQTHSRNRFESIQQFWRTLDSGEKQTFADEVANYPRTDSLGNEYLIQPINLQNIVNTNAETQGLPRLTEMEPPQPPPAISFDFAAIDISGQAMDIITTPQVLPGTHSMLIYVTRPVSPGQLSPGVPFVYLGMVPPSTDTAAFNYFAAYRDLFGVDSTNIGQIFHVVLQFISQVNFMSGLSIYANSEPIQA
jgi:hypothetical protein